VRCSLNQRITVSPPVWPGKRLSLQPGDLGVLIPCGIGMARPLPIREWDDPFSESSADYYGFQQRTGNPFHDAPLTSAAGGVVYFDRGCDEDSLKALCRLLAIRPDQRDYAAFLAESSDPVRDRWLVQLRLVSRFALSYLFGALGRNEYDRFPKQPLSLLDTIRAFMEDQEQHWVQASPWALDGTAGGDGDSAYERLGFGLMVENEYHGVYRIWSRAWLVTK